MSNARRLHYEYADYLCSLELTPLKLEYCDGGIYAMPPGTPAHAERSGHRRVPPTAPEGLPTVDLGHEGARRSL